MRIDTKDVLSLGFINNQNFFDHFRFKGVSTDSRSLKKDSLFFAIKGENFDGHNFVESAFSKGAFAAIVNEDWYEQNLNDFRNKNLVIVKNTLLALGNLAKIFRKKFENPIIAITGSNGKTTTKEMISRVLSKKYRVLKTEGNLNNQIGVPLMLFKLDNKYDFAVIEIGTNHFGEIKYLSEILAPDFGLITNIGRSHLEFFKNLTGVRREKADLFKVLAKNNKTGFVNGDDINVLKAAEILRNRITFGFKSKFNYSGIFTGVDNNVSSHFTLNFNNAKKMPIKLNIPGKYNLSNALASATVGLELGVKQVDVHDALASFKSSSKRMEVKTIKGITILNDCYNSNPDSAKAALETLAVFPAHRNKIIVFGDMLELGENKDIEHQKIGKLINKFKFNKAFLYGPLSEYIYEELSNKIEFCGYYKEKKELTKELKSLIHKGDVILIKGSRGMKMETILNEIENF